MLPMIAAEMLKCPGVSPLFVFPDVDEAASSLINSLT